jgi:dynein intermediate chain
VFATVDGTGSLDLWNLNEETEVPVARCQVAQRALNRIRWAQDGKKILAGDSGGNLYLCDLGEVDL